MRVSERRRREREEGRRERCFGQNLLMGTALLDIRGVFVSARIIRQRIRGKCGR